jgi:hypothetical protein
MCSILVGQLDDQQSLLLAAFVRASHLHVSATSKCLDVASSSILCFARTSGSVADKVCDCVKCSACCVLY